MAAYQTQQVNVGSIAAPDVGSVFANFADRINKQQNNQLDNMRQAAQFDRQQVLNQRADQEWNRQQGIIQAKKDVASDFAKNQYAEMYGGKQENAGLDKQVLDYVNNGGEINDDLAKRIQGLYETHKPFREDATAALTQQLIGKGLSAADATAEASGMTMGLPSRVELQTRSDAQRKAEQDYYDEVAKRNQKALDLKLDIAKANQTGDKETADIKLKQYQAMLGGGIGGSSGGSAGAPGGGYSDITNTLASIGFSDAGSALNEVDKARGLKYNDQQIASAIKQSIDADPTGVLFHDKKLNTEGFWGRLSQMTPGVSAGNMPLTIRDVKEPTAEEWASTVPMRAGYNVVDYKPNALLDRARLVVPELFKGDPNKITEETKVSNPVTSTNTNKYDGDYNTAVKKIETGSKNGDYSNVNKIGAMGAYQFMPSTLEYVNKITGKDISKDEFLKNPQIQDEYFKVLTEANKNVLSQRGIAPTDFNAWAAHNLGAGSVRKLLDTSTPADPVLARYIENNLPKGIEPTKENYINYYAPKFGTTIADVTNKGNVGTNPLIERNADNREKALGLDWSQQTVPATEQVGGVGNRVMVKTPEQKAQRIAEINQMLGSNPAINEETQALIDERASLSPKKTNLEAIQREILNPLSAMLPGASIGKVPGAMENLGNKFYRYFNPITDAEYAKSVESIGEAARRREVLRDIAENAPVQQAEREAILQTRNQARPTPDQIAEAKSMLAKKIEAINGKAVDRQSAFKNGANDYWNMLVQQRQAGLIDDAQLMKEMRMINDTGLINTRDLMEALDSIGFKKIN